MVGRWFRFYDNVVDDPKVQRLSDSNFRGWVNLMCIASRNDGKISSDLADISFALRISEGRVRDLLQVLQSAGLIERFETCYEPHNWATRQYKSDTSATRTKEWRERTRNVTGDDVVTSQDQPVTVTVTPPEQIQSRAETEQKDIPARKRASKPVVEPETFAEFWQAYPDSRARPDAVKAYRQVLGKGADPAAVLGGAKRYAVEVRGKEREFIKMAGGWLRDERWRDETGVVIRTTAFTSTEEQENQRKLKERFYGSTN